MRQCLRESWLTKVIVLSTLITLCVVSVLADSSEYGVAPSTRPFIVAGMLYMPDGYTYRHGSAVTRWKWTGGTNGSSPRTVGEGLEAGKRIAIDIGGAPGAPVWVDAQNESAKQFYRDRISQIASGNAEFESVQNQRARQLFIDYRQNRVDLVTSLSGAGHYITGEELGALVERQGDEVDAYLEDETNQQSIPDHTFGSGEYYEEEIRPIWNQLTVSSPFETAKKEARIIGLNALVQADKSFSQGEYSHARLHKDIALVMADYVLGITPGIGLAKDIYEAVTGVNILTGRKLDTADRWLAIVGSVTLGLGDDLLKTGRVIGKISKAVDGSGVDPKVLGGWKELSGMLREARIRKGDYGLGSASTKEANAVGKAWVGSGARNSSNGLALVSSDGLRQYRWPKFKPELNMKQANLEWRLSKNNTLPNNKEWQSNGHIDIWD